MQTTNRVRGWWVGGLVALAVVISSLALSSMASVGAVSPSRMVQPEPAPRAVEAADNRAAVASDVGVERAQPLPAPAPEALGTPAPSVANPRQAPLAVLLGLPAFVAIGLVALRLWLGQPAESRAIGNRSAAVPCPDCG
jgi:hypothetical protein